MPQIVSSGPTVSITLSFWEKIWSVHGNFVLEKSNVSSVSLGKPQSSWKELRVPGTMLPGVIKAGTYLTNRGKEFWYVSRTNKFPITIELRSSSYKRLVIGFSTESEQHSSVVLFQ